MRTIYFDYNATTPLDPEVREAMLPYLGENYGNPSSIHHVGRQARVRLDDARERVAGVWQCKPSEVTFTSGGTESCNLAVLGAARCRRDQGRHLVTSAIEHHAVLHAFDWLERREGFDVTRLPVSREGRVDPEQLAAVLRPDTILVSIMAANNETGAIQPVAEMGRLCRDRGILFHTDAVQWFGKEPFETIHQFHADLVSVCAHKFHGPKGAGALFIRSPLHPDPILVGGSHENERRAGTENLAGIIGFTEATERFVRRPVFERARLEPMTERIMTFLAGFSDLGLALQTPWNQRLANTVAWTFEGCDSMTLLAALDLEGICASSGSACSAGSLVPSHVIQAMGAGDLAAQSLIRFSLGRESTMAEVEVLEGCLEGILRRGQR